MREDAIEVIPVIDLMGGAVVRARHGLRQDYAPIMTPISKTSGPLDVIAGLLAIHPFGTFYIADLDRIESRSGNTQTIESVTAAFPGHVFWIDAGMRDAIEARSWLAQHKGAHLVLGSESLESATVLSDLVENDRIILSLDFRDDRFIGPKNLYDRPHLWPRRVIVMTLARVGSDAGPDMDRLLEVRRRAPSLMIYAAGGLRGADDLLRLEQIGISGVLVASALHDGRLTGGDLAAAENKIKGA
ncbi:HisA/HisF-related TIM barrel protein [Methylocapsa sp. D3K7]|uniref:HisA/HisF-related TIM barrel protein n=1 Tax=Methylocapsa sp. D3K7 TaxID=3041435 RepID=UPI00244E647B|nr:HisA/HisF-related TIM barrel protein [Methylocapsa sp. D3K7]WGJ13373.1 HisA/HisF-related TIM barrel protein [Methylocapsa sp. D3K7]